MESGGRETGRAGGEEIVLRRVAPEDEDFLLEVYASTREEELAQVAWAEGQREMFLRHQSDAQRQQYFARYPDAEYSVILYGGEPAGRIWIGRTPEQIRLLDIAILPAYRNRGIGGRLLRGLIEESEAAGKPLRHMVFKMNEGGLRFYERLGFRQIEDFPMYIHLERRPSTAPPPSESAG